MQAIAPEFAPLFALPLQIDLQTVADSPASVRAVVAFLGSTFFGGLVLYRYGDRVPGAVEASTANPLVSVVYGFIAYGLVGFAIGYVYSQVARIGISARIYGVVLVILLGAAFFSLGGLGFVIVGQWAADAAGLGDPWLGLVGVGLFGAAAVLAFPLAVGALVWLGIAAVGIGGPVKRWIHSDGVERRTS